jgi:exopolysaccharide biosynthesis protein
VHASAYVKQSNTNVSITSSKTGWQKIGNYYYFYNSKGRLLCGSIKYKGYYYYSTPNGRRYTGWITLSGHKYYYNRKNGAMFRNRWATGTKFTYYFNDSGWAIASTWLTYNGSRYYFNSDSTMATGWKKIGSYYYYFSKSSNNPGVMAKSTWVGNYYVDANGRRTSQTKPSSDTPVVTQNGDNYTYTSPTLNIELKRQSVHGVYYWVAHIKTKSATQLKSALSYGTYGGTRQTTSSAVSAAGGIIGVNGSAFDYSSGKPSPLGMCIKNGVIYGDYLTSYSVMAVKNNGIIYTPAQGLTGQDLLNAGVKDTYNFGPIIINNGSTQLPWAETEKYYPRTAIGMVSANDYVLLVTDTGNYSGLNHWDMATIFHSYGCQYAYNLDGGGSSTLYFNGKVMNKLIGDYQRPCADFLYFTR